MIASPKALVDAAIGCLVEARRRNADLDSADVARLSEDDERRMGVAITAAHTVIEPPSMPSDELRAMGLWWDR